MKRFYAILRCSHDDIVQEGCLLSVYNVLFVLFLLFLKYKIQKDVISGLIKYSSSLLKF
jgi:hypothetical protein